MFSLRSYGNSGLQCISINHIAIKAKYDYIENYFLSMVHLQFSLYNIRWHGDRAFFVHRLYSN